MVYTQKKIMAQRKGHKVLFKREEFLRWAKKNPKRCEYCGRTEDQWNLTKTKFLKNKRLTLDRKENTKEYVIQNICWACIECNTYKKKEDYEYFKRNILDFYTKHNPSLVEAIKLNFYGTTNDK